MVKKGGHGGNMELKYILFDMDGVILDSSASIYDATEYTLAQFGRKLEPEDAGRIIGPPLHYIYEQIFGFDPETAAEAIRTYRKRYYDVSYKLARPFEETVAMLEELTAHGKKLMLATARYADTAEFMLEQAGVRQFFCYLGCLDLNPDGTPGNIRSKSDVIRDVLTKNDIFDTECAVMVGDRAEDILGGRENSLMTIGALYGFGSEQELTEAGADYLADSPLAISRYIIENYE